MKMSWAKSEFTTTYFGRKKKIFTIFRPLKKVNQSLMTCEILKEKI
jgi:hypothetical protein